MSLSFFGMQQAGQPCRFRHLRFRASGFSGFNFVAVSGVGRLRLSTNSGVPLSAETPSSGKSPKSKSALSLSKSEASALNL